MSVRYYEVVVEIDETDYKSTSIIPAEMTEWTIGDPDFFELSEEGEYKFEILVVQKVVTNPQWKVALLLNELETTLTRNGEG